MSIILFSRPIRTGKTTELLHWCDQQKNIAGVAMPDIGGLRKIMDLRTHELIDAEVNDTTPGSSTHKQAHYSSLITHHSSPIIEIGKYRFYRSAFEKANKLLINTWSSKPGWLVIDELGKLELKGEGFYPAAEQILSATHQQPETNILLVVREGLIDEIVNLFHLTDFRTVSSL